MHYNLALGEQVIWINEIKKGLLHKHVIQECLITNQSVILNDVEHGKLYKVPITEVDPVVTNTQSVGTSYHAGSGRRGAYSGMSIRSGQKIGDLVCMRSGVPAISFRRIVDPYGVKNLIAAAKKRHPY